MFEGKVYSSKDIKSTCSIAPCWVVGFGQGLGHDSSLQYTAFKIFWGSTRCLLLKINLFLLNIGFESLKMYFVNRQRLARSDGFNSEFIYISEGDLFGFVMITSSRSLMIPVIIKRRWCIWLFQVHRIQISYDSCYSYVKVACFGLSGVEAAYFLGSLLSTSDGDLFVFVRFTVSSFLRSLLFTSDSE